MSRATRVLNAALVVAAVAALRAWSGGLSRVEVEGASMAPSLLPGDRLLVLGRARLEPGCLVVVRDPRAPDRELVKRVAVPPGGAVVASGQRLVAGPGEVVVLGDNADGSTDSSTFGPVPVSLVRGRPFYRYAPAGRTGPL